MKIRNEGIPVVCLSQGEASRRVRSLMCGYAKAVRERRVLVMLKSYVDDSGSNPEPNSVFVLAGYLMEEPRWEDFAERWDAQLRRPFAVDYCRMSDAEAGDGPFEGMDRIHRNRKVKDLAEVIRDCHPSALSVVMTWKDYIAHIKGQVDPRLDNPYAVLFFKMLAMHAALQAKINEVTPQEIKDQHGIAIKPVDFIFDDQGSAGLKCLQWYGTLRDRVNGPDRIVISNTPQFKDDRELLPLQAADMLAWHVRRAYSHPMDDRKETFDLIAPAGLWEYSVSPNELADIAYAFKTRVDPKYF